MGIMNAYYLCGDCNTGVCLKGLKYPVVIPAMCPKCVYTLMECFGFDEGGERACRKRADEVREKEPRLTSETMDWEGLFE